MYYIYMYKHCVYIYINNHYEQSLTHINREHSLTYIPTFYSDHEPPLTYIPTHGFITPPAAAVPRHWWKQRHGPHHLCVALRHVPGGHGSGAEQQRQMRAAGLQTLPWRLQNQGKQGGNH